MFGMGHTLDFSPFGIRHEGRPLSRLGCLIGPFQEVDEFCPVAEFRLPHSDDLEGIACPHDARRVIAKASVGLRLVLFEDLVDAQLLDHGRLSLLLEEIGRGTRLAIPAAPIERARHALLSQTAPAFCAYSHEAFASGTVRLADSMALALAAVPSRMRPAMPWVMPARRNRL